MTFPEIDRAGARLTTRSGFAFQVRPAQLEDQPALAEFFTHVEKEDLRFRFLSPINTVGPHLIAALANVDHDHTENILAFDVDVRTVIASATLAADPSGKRAEVAMEREMGFTASTFPGDASLVLLRAKLGQN